MATLTEDEHNELIDREEALAKETGSTPIVLRAFANALGHMLQPSEGVIVHLDTAEDDVISVIVMRDEEEGMVKVIPDPTYAEFDNGQLVWTHGSEEKAQEAAQRQKKKELH